MSAAEKKTDKPGTGHTSVQIDGVIYHGVYYTFYDNFRSVFLRREEKDIPGNRGELHHEGETYRIENHGTPGICRMIDRFIS